VLHNLERSGSSLAFFLNIGVIQVRCRRVAFATAAKHL
jgi:hypothetical protein